MRVSVGYKPFTDYWLNCYFNMVFSILYSIDPSYRYAAYMNDYRYHVSDWGTELSSTNTDENRTIYTHLILQPMEDFREKFLKHVFTYEPFQFKSDETRLDYLRDLIDSKNVIQVGVSLYHWLPESFNWHKNHWSHYSFINGYDREKKVFFAFDEDKNGYGEQEIPEERFNTALDHATLNPDGNIIKISDIPTFRFTLHDVVEYAKNRSHEIATMRMGPFWLLKDSDFNSGIQHDVISVHIFQIANRHKGNEFLFQTLQDRFLTREEITIPLVKTCRELQDGWTIVRAQMMRVYRMKTDRKAILNQINEKVKSLFFKEKEMWDQFIQWVS